MKESVGHGNLKGMDTISFFYLLSSSNIHSCHNVFYSMKTTNNEVLYIDYGITIESFTIRINPFLSGVLDFPTFTKIKKEDGDPQRWFCCEFLILVFIIPL